MKRITLPNIRTALETMRHEVTIDPALAERARRAVERMLAVLSSARVAQQLALSVYFCRAIQTSGESVFGHRAPGDAPMTVPPLPAIMIEPLVRAALLEDLGRAGDLTTDAIVPAGGARRHGAGARQPGVVAGLDFALTRSG